MYHAFKKQDVFSRTLWYPIVCRRRQRFQGTLGVYAEKKREFSSGFAKGDSEEPDDARSDHQYDIAIVGGGMVGMAFACSLATEPLTKHLKVAIIDSNPSLGSKICFKREDPPDARVSTVTHATIKHFKDAGVWRYVQQQRHAYFRKMQVWDYTGLGCTNYDARDIDEDDLGCVVENKVLLSSLCSRIEDTEMDRTLFPARIASLTLGGGASSAMDDLPMFVNGRLAKLELSDGRRLYSRLVVGADGGNSRVRELAGFETTGWSYSQSAVICTVEHEIQNDCAWQRFLPSGPIALLPIGDNFSNIVWTMSPQQASTYTSIDESSFLEKLNNAFLEDYSNTGRTTPPETPPKALKLASQRMAFPLSLRHANSYASSRVALAGDAAHTVHPLAGQGVNLGFEDAFALSKIVSEGVLAGADIGDISLLRKYEAIRKPANLTMMAILDGFQKAYAVDFGPLNIIRGAAFNAAQYCSPLKRAIVSYASGLQKQPFLWI